MFVMCVGLFAVVLSRRPILSLLAGLLHQYPVNLHLVVILSKSSPPLCSLKASAQCWHGAIAKAPKQVHLKCFVFGNTIDLISLNASI
jgi:hypothetical protein